tara:strand:+ start:384 stop:971 length:588 start_codon:yes stop_codon:yes gene_type:complete
MIKYLIYVILKILVYDENFKSGYNKLKHWVYEYNKIPRSNSRDENKYYLNKFVTNMRYYIWCSKEEFEKIKNNIKELENLPYWYWNRKNYLDEELACKNIKEFILKNNRLPKRSSENILLKTHYGKGIKRTYESHKFELQGWNKNISEHTLAVWCDILQHNIKISYLSKAAFDFMNGLDIWSWNYTPEKLISNKR